MSDIESPSMLNFVRSSDAVMLDFKIADMVRVLDYWFRIVPWYRETSDSFELCYPSRELALEPLRAFLNQVHHPYLEKISLGSIVINNEPYILISINKEK